MSSKKRRNATPRKTTKATPRKSRQQRIAPLPPEFVFDEKQRSAGKHPETLVREQARCASLRRSGLEVRPEPPRTAAIATRSRFRGVEALRFSKKAWEKLVFMCHSADTEVSGFGRCPPDDLLYVEDIVILKQECRHAYTIIDPDDLAAYMERLAIANVPLQSAMSIWIHTHPEMSANPSSTDEDTFAQHLENTNWMVMMIRSRTGDATARLGFKAGPGAGIPLNIQVAHEQTPSFLKEASALHAQWEEEIREKVSRPSAHPHFSGPVSYDSRFPQRGRNYQHLMFDYVYTGAPSPRHDSYWPPRDDGHLPNRPGCVRPTQTANTYAQIGLEPALGAGPFDDADLSHDQIQAAIRYLEQDNEEWERLQARELAADLADPLAPPRYETHGTPGAADATAADTAGAAGTAGTTTTTGEDHTVMPASLFCP